MFIPFFFVSTGMTLNVRSLIEHPAALARVPVFLAAFRRAARRANFRPPVTFAPPETPEQAES